jgi:hypothetical protein
MYASELERRAKRPIDLAVLPGLSYAGGQSLASLAVLFALFRCGKRRTIHETTRNATKELKTQYLVAPDFRH